MAWLISQALMTDYENSRCSQAQEEESSAESCLDGEQSAPLSGSPIPQAYLPSDRMTAFSRLSRFGMTFAPLTDDRGADLLTWFRAGFRARTSALQEKVSESLASAPACGPTWRASLAKFDPASSSWKTVQLSLLGDSELSSVTWPRSGMTAGGQCWELQMSAPHIGGTGSGLWQTPVADDAVNRTAGKWNSRGEPKLSAQVLLVKWPTPTVCGNYNRKGASATSGDGLATAVKKWPTPCSSDANKWSNQSAQERIDKGQFLMLPTAVSPQGGAGGILNPTWVEWLMGWPLEWTDLKPLAMDKYQFVRLLPFEC